MGLFGGKKTYVSSVLYNMAGEEKDRAQYLKMTVTGSILNGNRSLPETLQNSYLSGPGIKFRNFFRWTQIPANYDSIGVPTSSLVGSISLDQTVLAANIPHSIDESINIQQSEFDVADYAYWASQWMFQNEPTRLNEAWVSDYDDLTDEVVIDFPDLSQVRFSPTNFIRNAVYIYAVFNKTMGGVPGPLITGDVIVIGSDPFPSISGWTVITNTTTTMPVTLTETTNVMITYSDSTPDEESETESSVASSYQKIVREVTKTEYLGEDPGGDATYSRKSFMYQNQTGAVIGGVPVVTVVTEDIGGGVTKTTTTTVSPEFIELTRTVRIDTRDTLVQSWSPTDVFIYRIGSGNPALDALVNTPPAGNEYYPFIPCRINNKYVSELTDPIPFEQAGKAYKKITNSKLTKLIEDIDDNPSVGDIDYAYVAFGVSLNVRENACRKYLYNYFEELRQSQIADVGDYTIWSGLQDVYEANMAIWEAWKTAQSDISDPLYGTPEPTQPSPPPQPVSSVRIKSSGSFANGFDMEIKWMSIEEELGTGLAKAGAKNGEVWFELGAPNDKTNTIYNRGLFFLNPLNAERATIYWQINQTTWKSLKIRGMIHRNYIYNGKYVETSIKEALEDAEESGFLVPLHNPTMLGMSLVDTTQMATACCFMVFNCYKVVKQKWYQTGIFKIVLIIAIIAITVVSGGTGAFSAGLLGSAASVGAAIGLTGIIGLIAGAIINAVAAMLVARILSTVSTAIFGEKIGAIISAITTVVVIAMGSSMSAGQGLSASWGNMMSASGILNLTQAVGNGYAQYVQSSTNKLAMNTQQLLSNYNKESKEISDAYLRDFGYGSGVIDPMNFVDSSTLLIETGDQFLSRTLMTGSDVAALSLTMLNNFSELTLSTDLPTK